MLEFIRFSKGDAAYFSGMIALSPVLIAMKLGIVSKAAAKERMLALFFKGMKLDKFNELGRRFINEKLPSLIRMDAMQKVQEHLANGDEVVVVSASASNWMGQWCADHQLKHITTKLQSENNIISGKLNGPNCNGKEKVSRIKEAFNLADYSTIYCYGDTDGDKPMLALATHPNYRVFHQ